MARDSELRTLVDTVAIDVSSLAAGTVAEGAGPALTQGGVIVKSLLAVALLNLVAGEGPFLVGIASKDLTLAQIQGFVGLQGPDYKGDQDEEEIAARGRGIRYLGVLDAHESGVTNPKGQFFEVTPKLTYTEDGAGYKYWALNLNTAALSAGTQSIRIRGRHTVRWAP